jgi:hypothetical protein
MLDIQRPTSKMFVVLNLCQWMPYSSHIVLSLLTTLCSLRRQLPVSFKLVRLF